MPLLVFLHIIILVCDLTAIKEPSNRQSTSEGAVQNNVYNIMNVTICSPQAPTVSCHLIFCLVCVHDHLLTFIASQLIFG